MKFTASQISQLLGGTVEGNPEATVTQLAKIEEGGAETLSFLANPKYTSFIYSTKATIVIVNNDFEAEQPVAATLIRVPDAYQGFAKLLDYYNQMQLNKTGIDKLAYVSESATVGSNVYVGTFSHIGENVTIGNNVKIYPNCYIGDNVVVGDNTTVFAGVKIYNDCKLGAYCTLHAGVVIGADGFGFAPNESNIYKKVAQIGNVVIEDNVEIGANTTIDRATLGSTIIRRGVKLDNLIQIAHNVEVGENTVIASQTGVAGSTKIGRDCMIGGQVGIVGHLTIANGVKIAAQSGISNSITTEGDIIQGSPAFGMGDYKRSYVMFRKLPQLERRIQELEAVLAEIKQAATK